MKVSNASVASMGVVNDAGSVEVGQVNVPDAVIEDSAGNIGLSDVNATAEAGNIMSSWGSSTTWSIT